MIKLLTCISVYLITSPYCYGLSGSAFNKYMDNFKGEYREESQKGFANLKSDIRVDIRTEIENTLNANFKIGLDRMRADITAQIGVGNKSHNQGDIINDTKIVYSLIASNVITLLSALFILYKLSIVRGQRESYKIAFTETKKSKDRYKDEYLNIIKGDKK